MAKYGTFKYGTQKYGAIVNAGGATLSPSGLLESLKMFLKSVGGGLIGITGTIVKVVKKPIGGIMLISGAMAKLLFYLAGNGIVSSTGNATKRMFVSIGGAISSIVGSLTSSRIFLCNVGQGAINIAGSITRLIQKSIGGTVTISGNASKTMFVVVSGTVTMAGNAAKTMFVVAGGAISSITGTLSKQVQESVGNGSIAIAGALSKLAYYFLVTLDQILQPLGVQVIGDSRKDLFPEIKEYTDSVPGRHGEIFFGSNLKSKALELHVSSDENLTPAQKETQKRLYAKYLDATKGEKNLIFEDDAGKVYKVKYAGKIDINPSPSSFDFTIPFKMSTPYLSSNNENIASGNTTLTNSGNAETPLIIQAAGPLANPSIVIDTYTLAYSGTIAAGQILIIDTENMTAELDGVNVINNVSGELPLMLQPGDTAVTASAQISFLWRDRWC